MRDLEKLADKIVFEVDRAVREVQDKIDRTVKRSEQKARKTERRTQRGWESQPGWSESRTVRDFQTAATKIKKFPTRISDLATDGSCAMRYLFAYCLKGWAFCQGFGGLMLVAITLTTSEQPWHQEEISIGLVLLATSQVLWWIGQRVTKAADQKAYARDQHRILRLAREKGGNLTVIEAATDGRMTAEKAEEILRKLAVQGHAEIRVTDSGVMVYHFLEISRWDEKQWARPVDEL